MKLVASVQSVRYCAGDNDVYTVGLHLRLRYFNGGNRKLILLKPKGPIEIVTAVIATDTDALREHRYEAALQYDQFVRPDPAPRSNPLDLGQLALIASGNSYELPGTMYVPARFRMSPSISGTLAPGHHVAIFDVTDWAFSPESGKRLQEVWSRYGVLEYGTISTEPVEFDVPVTPNLQRCNR